MTASRIRMGLVGPGFIAAHHIDAVRRLGDVDVVAIAGSNLASASQKAKAWHVERAYARFEDLIDDDSIQVIHNTTPNHLHFEVTDAALRAGKHVISDKPLARTVDESQRLVAAARAAKVANVVTFNYRGNALIQQARSLVASGQAGRIVFIHGCYLQDWLTDERAYSWRCDPASGGASSALADIGSHWCDLAEHVSGERICEVLADFSTVVRSRSIPGQLESAVELSGEEVASVLVRFSSGAKGAFTVGQVLPGHKNDLQLEVCGRQLSLRWEQERQSDLWVGAHDQPNRIVTQDPEADDPLVRHFTRLPAGHQQGWSDAFANIIADAYEWIRLGGMPETKPTSVATFEDGHRANQLVDAMVRSFARGGVWQSVD